VNCQAVLGCKELKALCLAEIDTCLSQAVLSTLFGNGTDFLSVRASFRTTIMETLTTADYVLTSEYLPLQNLKFPFIYNRLLLLMSKILPQNVLCFFYVLIHTNKIGS